MIALLRGVLVEKHPNQAILETGGVGYDVTIPVSTFTHLPDKGAEVQLRIHTHVREDALALFGFLTQDEKNIFEKLIGVSGIGPTLAVKVLSGVARTRGRFARQDEPGHQSQICQNCRQRNAS